MKTYSKFRPTGFDPAGLNCEDQQDWLVAPCGHNRDSDILQECNWKEQEKILVELESPKDWEIHRFGHWANGWFEIVLIRPDTKAAGIAEELENALSDYPVISDEAYSEAESLAIQEEWTGMRLKDRVNLINEHNKKCYTDQKVSIFAARKNWVPDNLYHYMRESL